jgi:Uma2 family endonuclease
VGGSFAHVLLISNLCGELRNALRGRPCRAVSSELLFRTGSGRLFAYPDVLVFCEPVAFADDRKDVALNPIVVAEVLSPGTEGFDRGKKAAEYRGTEPVQQYLLVSQDEVLVELHTRDGNGWRLREVRGLDGVCWLESLGVEIGMVGIYDGVELGG